MSSARRHASSSALDKAFRLEKQGRRFADPRIEARFRVWRRRQMLPYIRMGCAAAFVICALGIGFAAAAAPQHLVTAILIVTLLVAPLVLLTLWLSQRPRQLLEPVTTASGAVTALAAVWLTHESLALPGAASAVIAFITFFSFALCRLPTASALLTVLPGTAYAISLVIADHQSGLMSAEALAFSIFLPLATLITASLASLELELRLHRAFRNELLIKAQKRALRDERMELCRFLPAAVSRRVHDHGIEPALTLQTLMLTAVCCDLRGFTHFTDIHGPQRMAQVLNDYYAIVIEIAGRHDALVKDFIGDGALILVGAPRARPDHAEAAVAMARLLNKRIAELTQRRSAPGVPLGIGIGVASGICAVGVIGSRRRLEYAAVGSAVNLASRLCTCADDGEVLISSQTTAMSHMQPDGLSEARTLQLKGFDSPVCAAPMAATIGGKVAASRESQVLQPPA